MRRGEVGGGKYLASSKEHSPVGVSLNEGKGRKAGDRHTHPAINMRQRVRERERNRDRKRESETLKGKHRAEKMRWCYLLGR